MLLAAEQVHCSNTDPNQVPGSGGTSVSSTESVY